MSIRFIKAASGTADIRNLPNSCGIGYDTATGSIAYNGDGTVRYGIGRSSVVSGSGATVTLTSNQSGSTILFDRAAGIIYTLPAPVVGLYFEFIYTVSVTTNSYDIVTDAGTTFMGGSLSMGLEATTPAAAAGPKFFSGNGTSHVKISSDGATKGGLKGGWVKVTCVTSTLWSATGILTGTGSIASPFA